jgi:hypothetical protein
VFEVASGPYALEKFQPADLPHLEVRDYAIGLKESITGKEPSEDE